MPDITYKPRDDRQSRREFERRQAEVQRLLQQEDNVATFGFHKVRKPWMDAAIDLGIKRLPVMDLEQVRRYVNDEGCRGAILRYIRDQLPTDGDMLLIGHSLGSVIAIDLLDHLPEKLRVRRFITIGSPANSSALHGGSERLLKKFPYSRVDDWTNFFNYQDIVTGGRGLASIFPGAQDFATKVASLAGHPAEDYLKDPAVVKLIAGILYPSKEVVPVGADMAVRLTDDQLVTLIRLHFARAVAGHIKDDERRNRYTDALNLIQDDLAAQLQQTANAGKQLPSELYSIIAGDLPELPHRLELSEAVTLLTRLTATNFVEPYEIDTGDAPKDAIDDMLERLGFSRSNSIQIGIALTEVNDLLKRSGGIPWGRIGVAAAGLALLAAGPVGLMAAAPATAYGAAAITGGLAAFGPGGMIGGIATLGSLAAGGAGLAAGAAFNDTSPETVMLNVTELILRVAADYAHKLLHLPIDTELWGQLTRLETQVSAELNRLEPFDDPKSTRLQQLRAAREAVRKLLGFVVDKGIGGATAIDGSQPD